MGAIFPLNNFRYDPNALTPGAFGAPATPTFDPSTLGQSMGYPAGTQGQALGSPFATSGPALVAPPVTNVGYPAGNNLGGPSADMFQMNAGVGQSFKPGYAPVLSPAASGSISLPGMEMSPAPSAPVSYPMPLGPTQFEMAQPDPSAMYGGALGMLGAQNGQIPAWQTPASSPYMPAGTRFSALA